MSKTGCDRSLRRVSFAERKLAENEKDVVAEVRHALCGASNSTSCHQSSRRPALQTPRGGGINIKRVRVLCYAFMRVGSAFAGVFSVLINFTLYPTGGDGYLLPTLASVFVGGTAP
jgi:hypothetical protein